jgi:hypothetical protein
MFLHGVMEEEVNMRQSLVYENKQLPNYVWKLDKRHLWVWKKCLEHDYMFKYKRVRYIILYLWEAQYHNVQLIYVDDIIVASSSSEVIYALLKDIESRLEGGGE